MSHRRLRAHLARLLASLAEVEPPIDEDTREVVRAEDEEGDVHRALRATARVVGLTQQQRRRLHGDKLQ